MKNSRLIPTKKEPLFIAHCSAFGSINSIYKMGEANNCGFDVFAKSYIEAIEDLHIFIRNHSYLIEENKYCDFSIEVTEGKADENGETIYKKVYSISKAKVKKYILS